MKHKRLIQTDITLYEDKGLYAQTALFPLKSTIFSTKFLPYLFLKYAVNSQVWKIMLLFFLLPVCIHALPGAENRVKIRQNDAAVTVTVDKPMANKDELVTITLSDIPNDKKAIVTVGKTFGQSDVSVDDTGAPNTYTFTMPDYAVYIDVDIQSLSTDPVSYPLTVEISGVASSEVQVHLAGDGVTGDATTGYQVEAGTGVIVTLQTPLADKLALLKTEAFAPGGSWRWAGLEGNPAVSVLTFDMPPAAVTVRFSIRKDTGGDIPDTPNPPYNPGIPDTPDSPDIPDTPDTPGDGDDEPSTANEPVALSGLRVHTACGVLSLVADRPGEAIVYTIGGRLVKRLSFLPAIESRLSLPSGIYILLAGNESIKIYL